MASKISERDIIRREIQGILISLAPPANASNPVTRRNIIKQSYGFESILYRQSSCMESYCDLSTLEGRVRMAAVALRSAHQERAVTVTRGSHIPSCPHSRYCRWWVFEGNLLVSHRDPRNCRILPELSQHSWIGRIKFSFQSQQISYSIWRKHIKFRSCIAFAFQNEMVA